MLWYISSGQIAQSNNWSGKHGWKWTIVHQLNKTIVMVNLRYLSKISNFQLVRTSSYLTSRLTFHTHPSANATQKISRYSSSVLPIFYQFPPEYFRSHLKNIFKNTNLLLYPVWLVVYLPLWKMEFVSWGYFSQYMGNIKFMFQTTNQPVIS